MLLYLWDLWHANRLVLNKVLRNLLKSVGVIVNLGGVISPSHVRIVRSRRCSAVNILETSRPASCRIGVDVVLQTGDLQRGVGPVEVEVISGFASVGHGRVHARWSGGVEGLSLESQKRFVRRSYCAVDPFKQNSSYWINSSFQWNHSF